MAIAAFQGVDGAYSQLALTHFLADRGVDARTLGLSSYRELAAAVASGRADAGIIPIENAIVGTVREGYDLLAEFRLAPLAEINWRTDHRLLGVRGASLRDVREVLGHPLVIAECGTFLAGLPHARAIPCEDTGIAAREVARGGNPSIAALAPPAAAALYDLDELAANCSDDPHTYSRFLVFTASPIQGAIAELTPSSDRKTSIVFSVAHRTGALAEALTNLAACAINVAKLESKPRLGHSDETTFYADLEGDLNDPHVKMGLDEMRRSSKSLVLLGSFDVHRGLPIGANERAPRRSDATLRPVRPAVSHPVVETPFPRVARISHPSGTSLRVGNVTIEDGTFTIVAGPCAVESREQVLETAHGVQTRGAAMLRGGAFKPRTSPYAFQGLGWEGVDLLAEAGRATGLPTISEVMTIDQVETMAERIDVLQVGARNMQNFDLLKAVGRAGSPVLLKRGLSATIDELLAAAEYILAEGNPNVILCERGIRTFETATRNTLDLSAVPVLRERTHLPVFVDPSHGVGVRRWIAPLARAAKAVGAHGLLLEVHWNPAEAKSDKDQALTFDDFAQIVAELDDIPVGGVRQNVGARVPS